MQRPTHRIEATFEVVADDESDAKQIVRGLMADFITDVNVSLIEPIEQPEPILTITDLQAMWDRSDFGGIF